MKNNKIFAGNPYKAAHTTILEGYFGRLPPAKMYWKQIKVIVLEMFINIKDLGKPIGFYGEVEYVFLIISFLQEIHKFIILVKHLREIYFVLGYPLR